MTTNLSLFNYLDRRYASKIKITNEDYMKIEGKRMVKVETLSRTKSLRIYSTN